MNYINIPQKVREQFSVYGILGTGSFGEVRLAFEKVSIINKIKTFLKIQYLCMSSIYNLINSQTCIKLENINKKTKMYIKT